MLVTQKHQTLLGGVNQQKDNLKLMSQVRDAVNVYPDVTFGLIKRSGAKFIAELRNYVDDELHLTDAFDNGKWFSIFRDQTERYVGVVTPVGVNVWDIITGAPQTINYFGTAEAYLSTATNYNDFDVLTLNDFSFITNKKRTITAQANGTVTSFRGFVAIKALVYNAEYKVTINGNTKTYASPVDATGGVLTLSTVTAALVTELNTITGVTAEAIGAGIHITMSTAFTLSAVGGNTGDALQAFTSTIPNVSLLPTQCKDGYVFKVVNTSGEADDYFVRFQADAGVGASGTGVWIETRDPLSSPGLTASTMPHELVSVGGGVFEFRPVSWEQRLVGDMDSNPNPSFVGSTINKLFFYQNRLGALTNDNVILSQSGDYFNFFAASALTVVDSDPIDSKASTTRPSAIYAVVPVAQGLLLFSNNEQFLFSSGTERLTPGTNRVRTLSKYSFDITSVPAELGSTTAFLSKSETYCRVFEIETLGNEESPYVKDISKVVPEWIPSNVDLVTAGVQNDILSVSGRGLRTVYQFKFWGDAKKREAESWYKWQMSGPVQYHTIEEDVVWFVTKQASAYVLQSVNLTQSPLESTLETTDGLKVDPRLDMWVVGTDCTYDEITENSKVRIPWNHSNLDGLSFVVLTANSGTGGPDYANAGVLYSPAILEDDEGFYALVEDEDLSAENLIIGYTYDYQVDIPQLYYRVGDNKQITDVTADLTIARIKFAVGLTGDITFKVKAKGREEWINTQSVKQSDEYILNDLPFVSEAVFTVPIMNKSNNYDLSVFSDSPFPVSLISMMWEGRYTPRSYTRRF